MILICKLRLVIDRVIPRLKFCADEESSLAHAGCMKLLSGAGLQELLADHDGVVSTSEVLKYMTEDQLRWQISSGRWQKPARGVVVTQSGPLTYRQALRAALL